MKITVNLVRTSRIKSIIAACSIITLLFFSLSLYYIVKNINNYNLIKGEEPKEAVETSGLSSQERTDIKNKADLINLLIAKRAFPWLSMLKKFEKSTPKNVALEKLVPDFKNKTINISGVGDDIDDITEYVEKLQKVPDFENVLLTETKNSREGMAFNITIAIR